MSTSLNCRLCPLGGHGSGRTKWKWEIRKYFARHVQVPSTGGKCDHQSSKELEWSSHFHLESVAYGGKPLLQAVLSAESISSEAGGSSKLDVG
ncbi:unnamed protein product [Protopolystoma xenopodis]|uniref:Uncharacterized protein n=1 Tax=Protopolystoma xenopodis TaxID=117903 RepID=A0A448XCJ5_9PLAT|nr:unnamed protein product [Protopolystoma xenopodis]